jgi:hypothetical protein
VQKFSCIKAPKASAGNIAIYSEFWIPKQPEQNIKNMQTNHTHPNLDASMFTYAGNQATADSGINRLDYQ